MAASFMTRTGPIPCVLHVAGSRRFCANVAELSRGLVHFNEIRLKDRLNVLAFRQ